MHGLRFLGYFVALAACSTIAFASSWTDSPAPQEASDTEQTLAIMPSSYPPMHLRGRKTLPKRVQVALAE